ncbi:hypothetical protein ZIOFF_000260 [Zingiber officinale]|uniref:Alkaline/neutral invertase n=1 Tax=Zingiber officinale TaxID=94328 RepID=A0A8J5IHQ5_ZINOF|nr:hypothetical protein ZIOFF_000260 [Zingiber officinale]
MLLQTTEYSQEANLAKRKLQIKAKLGDGACCLLLIEGSLHYHSISEYFWVDMKKINEIYRYKTEEYSQGATNKFNIYPEQIPSWLVDWIPEKGGYLIGNLQPAHMNFWFFSLGLSHIIMFTLACIKMGRPELARKAVSVAEKRLSNDQWPEYYDTLTARFISNQSRLYQTWTIAGFLASKLLPENPEMASIFTFEEDMELLEGCAYSPTNHPRAKCS